MPIYEYTCTACGKTTDILHGINDAAPQFCPECGAEKTLRKGFAPPAIVFKGSGWAKKDRSAGSRTKAAAADGGSGDKPADGGGDKARDGRGDKAGDGDGARTGEARKSGEAKKAADAGSTPAAGGSTPGAGAGD